MFTYKSITPIMARNQVWCSCCVLVLAEGCIEREKTLPTWAKVVIAIFSTVMGLTFFFVLFVWCKDKRRSSKPKGEAGDGYNNNVFGLDLGTLKSDGRSNPLKQLGLIKGPTSSEGMPHKSASTRAPERNVV